MELFLKYKTIIFRVTGTLMLLIGFAVYFWTTPKPVLTQNEIAAQNVARMEAKVSGGKGGNKKPESSGSKIMTELKETQKKQLRYMVIIMMISGVAFLGYSFVGKKED